LRSFNRGFGDLHFRVQFRGFKNLLLRNVSRSSGIPIKILEGRYSDSYHHRFDIDNGEYNSWLTGDEKLDGVEC
jgi:hypothetical protein